MSTTIFINCHCGGYEEQYLELGSSGWFDCKCGCGFAYRNVDGQAEVKKAVKCDRKISKRQNDEDEDFDDDEEDDDEEDEF